MRQRYLVSETSLYFRFFTIFAADKVSHCCCNTHFKPFITMLLSRSIIRHAAWMLIIAFMIVVMGQALHSFSCEHRTTTFSCAGNHNDCYSTRTTTASEQQKEEQSTQWSSATEKSVCSICDFHFFQSSGSIYFQYTPFLSLHKTELLERAALRVYRLIFALNAHSPPFA